MHVCTSQLVLPIVFIVHLFNIVFYLFFYYPYGLLSEIKYYYYIIIFLNVIHLMFSFQTRELTESLYKMPTPLVYDRHVNYVDFSK